MRLGIAVNHFHPSIGGCETVIKTIAEYLAEHHDVFILTRKIRGRDHRDFEKYSVLEYTPGNVVAFDRTLIDLGLDVLMIYSDVFDFFRNVATRKNEFRLIIALCGANWLYTHRNYVKILYRHIPSISALICHSKYERDYRLCSTDRFSDKVQIIPNGVDLEEFDTNKISRKKLLPHLSDKKWILNVSNFFPGKGQEHMMDILLEMPDLEKICYIQVCNEIEFAIGAQLESRWKGLTSKVTKKGITVEFLQDLPREEVVGFFKQSNAFAFTSEKEVAPLVLLESMAASLPWVSTNVGNAEELEGGSCIKSVKNAKFHNVFDNRVNKLFAEGLSSVWNAPRIGKAGRKQVEERFTWEKILPQYLKLIENA